MYITSVVSLQVNMHARETMCKLFSPPVNARRGIYYETIYDFEIGNASFRPGNFEIGLPLAMQTKQTMSGVFLPDSEEVSGWIGSVFRRLFHYGRPAGVRNDRKVSDSPARASRKWKVDSDRKAELRRSLRRNWRRQLSLIAAHRAPAGGTVG